MALQIIVSPILESPMGLRPGFPSSARVTMSCGSMRSGLCAVSPAEVPRKAASRGCTFRGLALGFRFSPVDAAQVPL